jgi:hypothetical protein
MTYLDTPIDATVTNHALNYSSDQIKQMHYDLSVLAKENEKFRLDVGSLRRQLMEKDSYIANAKTLILEAFDMGDFDKDSFTAVAEALEIELTQEYNVTINVTFSGTVTVPLGFDTECDLENYIDFEASASGYGNEDVECDLFTDGIDVTMNN